MSTPEPVVAVTAAERGRRSSTPIAVDGQAAGPTAAGEPSSPLPLGVAGFAQTLAATTAAAGRPGIAGAPGGSGATAGGAWAIPWAGGSAPVQHALTTAQIQARAKAHAGGTAGVATAHALGGPAAAPSSRTGRAAGGAGDALSVSWPMQGRISQKFGPTTSKYSVPHTINGVTYAHFHDGIDIAGPVGRPVRTIAAGEVIFSGFYPDGAEVVRVKHADGTIALYAHLDRDTAIHKGDRIPAGTQIGKVGSNGNITGPHLHLELLSRKGVDLDPLIYLRRGRLPGTTSGHLDTSVLPADMRPATPAGSASATATATSSAALARFDAVAGRIPFHAEIRDAAVRAGIDPLLLASLVKAESSFHPTSVSRCGAMGLCQLMPATAKALHVTDPFDPTQNLRAGAKYLANNLRIYGRVDLSLAAYQAGKGAVARAGNRVPDSPTTRNYVNRILHTWAGYMEAAA